MVANEKSKSAKSTHASTLISTVPLIYGSHKQSIIITLLSVGQKLKNRR